MKPIIVTGMHRSGTSAVARLVRGLGVDVGSNLLPATEGNVYGHFEEASFIAFHDALISRCFPRRAPFCEWLPLADADVVYDEGERRQAAAMWRAHRASGGNAWKDPRTSLFLDLWLETLPDVQVIVCLRHPYQVHRSLLRRGESFLHVDYGAAITGWNIYNQRILKVISALPKDRFTVLDVEAAFREPRQLTEGLAKFLGVTVEAKAVEAIVPEAFNFEDDVHDALDHFESYLPEAGATYRQLKQFDLLHPVAFAPAPAGSSVPIQSHEARLIEFEERYGLRARSKKMLVRSIGVDRQRMTDLYQQALAVSAEKDGLIDDLSRLNDALKRRIMGSEKPAARLDAP